MTDIPYRNALIIGAGSGISGSLTRLLRSAGLPIDRDALVAQAGLDWQMVPSTTLGVGYAGQFGQRAQDHGMKGNFVYRF